MTGMVIPLVETQMRRFFKTRLAQAKSPRTTQVVTHSRQHAHPSGMQVRWGVMVESELDAAKEVEPKNDVREA